MIISTTFFISDDKITTIDVAHGKDEKDPYITISLVDGSIVTLTHDELQHISDNCNIKTWYTGRDNRDELKKLTDKFVWLK